MKTITSVKQKVKRMISIFSPRNTFTLYKQFKNIQNFKNPKAS